MNCSRPSLFLLSVFLTALPVRAAVENFKVTTDHSIDASSLENVVQGVTARAGAKTNDEKAIAIYDYLHHTIFHWACPVEKTPQSVGPLKVLNVYGWGLCGSEHTVLKASPPGWRPHLTEKESSSFPLTPAKPGNPLSRATSHRW